MSTKEKTRPGAGTPERATETAACSRAAISCNYSTTSAAGRQRKVSDFLSHGRENAVPLRHLKTLLDADGRTVRLMIQHERLTGTPICADNLTGYGTPRKEATFPTEGQATLHIKAHTAPATPIIVIDV